jgi:hypothetical protein
MRACLDLLLYVCQKNQLSLQINEFHNFIAAERTGKKLIFFSTGFCVACILLFSFNYLEVDQVS